MKPPDHKIYLASKSPRRRELLRQIGVDFELLAMRENPVRGADVSEAVLSGENASDYVIRITIAKAESAHKAMVMRRLPMRPVLAADTTVTIDGAILGKPADRTEAITMITRLAGRTHEVLTSVVLKTADDQWQVTRGSLVTFAPLSEKRIEAYCFTTEPYDKAGGYAVQGRAASFIAEIAGSYSGIMGLPLHETAQLLQQAGIPIP